MFDGHGALKLGTHCQTGYEDYVLREYAAYRIYKQLEQWYPSLNTLLDPKMLKICREHPEACGDSSIQLTR